MGWHDSDAHPEISGWSGVGRAVALPDRGGRENADAAPPPTRRALRSIRSPEPVARDRRGGGAVTCADEDRAEPVLGAWAVSGAPA